MFHNTTRNICEISSAKKFRKMTVTQKLFVCVFYAKANICWICCSRTEKNKMKRRSTNQDKNEPLCEIFLICIA